jgi:hypothetical protein
MASLGALSQQPHFSPTVSAPAPSSAVLKAPIAPANFLNYVDYPIWEHKVGGSKVDRQRAIGFRRKQSADDQPFAANIRGACKLFTAVL